MTGCLVLSASACSIHQAATDPIRPGDFDPITTEATFSPLPDDPPVGAIVDSPSTTALVPLASTVGLDQLVVAEEAGGAGYDRGLFEHWIDIDLDGCDTKCEVLAAERRTDVPGIADGWFSVYDWLAVADPADLDVDHLVPLAEAWRSGAADWDAGRRRAFANDLEDPDALLAVTASSNREKADQDPANWRPPRREQWCWYAGAWIRVKASWHLTVDPAERDALVSMLARC